MKRYLIRIGLLCLMLGSLLLFTRPPVNAAARTVDGNPADWTGTPSATPHTDAESATEWIYTGASGDRGVPMAA